MTGVPLGALAGDRFGWRVTFAGVAVLSAVVAVAARLLLPASNPGAPGAMIRARLVSVRTHGVPRVLATTLLGILAGYLGYTYAAPVADARGARGGGALAVVLGCFGAGAVCGALLSGMSADRYPQPLVARAGATLQVGALAVLAILDAIGARLGTLPVAAAFTLLGAGSFNCNAPQQRALIELAPASATTLISLNSSAIYAGIGLSGALGGLALQAGPAATCGAGALIAAATALVAGKQHRRRAATARRTASATALKRNGRNGSPCTPRPASTRQER